MSNPYELRPGEARQEDNILTRYTAKELGRWALITMKTEIALYDLRQSLYWQSILELALLVASVILLLFRGKTMVFLHALHGLRPVLAGRIIYTMPRLNMIYEFLPDDLEDAGRKFQDHLMDQCKRGSRLMSFYLITTGVAAVFDLLGLIIDLVGVSGESNSAVYYSLVAWVFLCFDAYLVFWYYSLRFHFPAEIWASLYNLALGNIQEAKTILNSMVQRRQA